MKRHLYILAGSLLVLSLFLSGCAQNITRSSASTSFNKIIEPVADSRRVDRTTKPLTLPLSVAILTIPSSQGRHVPNTTLRLASEKLKEQLLAYPKYVNGVTIVEKDDLANKISLEKIGSGYGADVAIVLSYQQDQRTDQSGFFGLLDATGVGAFLVPGVALKTASIIDGKVIHIPSQAIIFRASGKDDRTGRSTSYGHQGALTQASIDSIVAATADFGNALTAKIDKFDKYDLSQAMTLSALAGGETKTGATGASRGEGNDYWNEVNTFKRTGGGAFGFFPLLISAAICCAAWRRK